jgi:glycerol-3-phosphate dehydrogenase
MFRAQVLLTDEQAALLKAMVHESGHSMSANIRKVLEACSMNRESMVKSLEELSEPWEIIIIGGGATGLGCAVDAASRGFRALLLEQHDFAKGTSSRSTKLIHGGVRYLKQGNIPLVVESLRERGLLIKNAPHLVRNLPFLVPSYDWWDGPFYAAGMKIYDMLAGRLGFGHSRRLSRDETINCIPNLQTTGLHGGVVYHDGQFDDARLAINLAQTAADYGATLVNYMQVTSLLKSAGRVTGVRCKDMETGTEYQVCGKVVINAAGVFTDNVNRMDAPGAQKIMAPSQGIHLVLDKDFLPGETALMVPHTEDGRVLFAVPWHDKVVVGTTETPIDNPSLEPSARDEEISFVLRHASKYLKRPPKPEDVLSVFAGLRPLVCPNCTGNTAPVSRDYFLGTSKSGLVTITGGKWTTYRKMAKVAIDQALRVAGLDERACKTKRLHIHGWLSSIDTTDPLSLYGADALKIRNLIDTDPNLGKKLHEAFSYSRAEVLWAVREEMALTVEDILARRTRCLFLSARASMEAAPEVAEIMVRETGKDEKWQKDQVAAYNELAARYLVA